MFSIKTTQLFGIVVLCLLLKMLPGDVPLRRYYTVQRHRRQNRRHRELVKYFSLLHCIRTVL